jgi:hypothetical protein
MDALPQIAVATAATVAVVAVIVCVLRRASRKVDKILRDEIGPPAEEPKSVAPRSTSNAPDFAVPESGEMATPPKKFTARAARSR